LPAALASRSDGSAADQQPVETGALVLLATAAHMPVAHTNDLRRLPPGDLFADGS